MDINISWPDNVFQRLFARLDQEAILMHMRCTSAAGAPKEGWSMMRATAEGTMVRNARSQRRPNGQQVPGIPVVPIPFSVFPSAYRNAEVKETTSVKVEGEAKLTQASHGREGHEETHESFSATVHAPQPQAQHRDTYIKEEVRITEEERLRRPQPQLREEVHIREQTRYRHPEQQQQHQPQQQRERVEFAATRDRYQPPSSSSSHSHIEVQDRSYDRHFNTVHGPATDYAPSQIDVSERQFRERTRPIVAEQGYTNLSTNANHQQASRYTRETVTAKDTYASQPKVESVDAHYPSQVRVEKTTRATVDAPKKHKRDMGYYDDDGHYHSFRQGISKAAHKVADRVAHPIHPHRHQHYSTEHSHTGSKYDDLREEVVVKEKYTTAIPAHPPSRPVQSGAPVERVVRVNSSSNYAPAPRSSAPAIPAAPATARKMASPNTITIPCHHIRIGDLLILQGRPCQVIRITTSSQTGQHRYLGVDLFTKQLHEESSFISNPAPSVVVQNMLGPVFKQYRVLDIREDGRVVAMTESGDVKQGLPVLDQSALLSRLTESFDNGRGSVRILVINDDGLEMAVDYKVVHGSRL
ncbi:woronin body major protein [Paraphoma chrysanthemicola]|nr:woronin body major protein [Paraphoma chrysanthemicola]